MLLKSEIQQIAKIQQESVEVKNTGLQREIFSELKVSSTHALIISGVRRCGKSTLLYQLLKRKYNDAFYFNFEHPSLYNFEKTDFQKLDEIIKESGKQILFFDEIQIIEDWERFIRLKLDENYTIIITGSNASLLSRELGTKLTGRHITKELFPFSFQEFCSFCDLQKTEQALLSYLQTGGFPEYVKTRDEDNLTQLFDDILVRDIAIRYGIRDLKTLKSLALFIISNTGKYVTGNKLKALFNVGSTSTIMEYMSHLEQSYLLFFVQKFSYSVRKQMINPRKVYTIDTGLVNVNSLSFSKDFGRKLENSVFLHLRRQYKDIYYYAEKGECDFIVVEKGEVTDVIQVCYQLTQDNLDRELNGLFEALHFFNRDEGSIITLNQSDRFEKDGKVAKVVPFYNFVTED
ncbi:MAG: hypothetical protein FD181_381 [Prolixibacteraceae bacterium]|nr:MAG: hypothetical protein FD181_381 [Prolixibacteraceae bacterium]